MGADLGRRRYTRNDCEECQDVAVLLICCEVGILGYLDHAGWNVTCFFRLHTRQVMVVHVLDQGM